MPSTFAFCSCQPGAEAALKGEVAARLGDWRFSYSRPGFVTFRLPSETTVDRFEPPKLTFARTLGLSLGKVRSDAGTESLAQQVWGLEAVGGLLSSGSVGLHVWQRDTALPGDDGLEPGPTALSTAAYEELVSTAPTGALRRDAPSEENASGVPAQRVALDVVLVEPNEWWVGAHAIRSRTDRWPGGAPPLELPEHAVSRAYLKLQEGLRWSALPTRKGDRWVELGCAPGGASQALLDAGMGVVGVDPAEVDPVVLAHPRFTHLRRRSAEVPFDELAGVGWLAADINAAPSYTLDSVESIVVHPGFHIRGLLLTLKLLGPNLARPEMVAESIARIRSWGFADVRARQLAFNRREYCVAGLRTRGQRRLVRGRSRVKKRR